MMLPPVNKNIPRVVSHIEIHRHICLELFWTIFTCKRCLNCANCSPDSDQTTISLEKAIIWTLVLAGSNDLKLKNVLMMDLFLTNMQLFTSKDIN